MLCFREGFCCGFINFGVKTQIKIFRDAEADCPSGSELL